MPKINSGRNTIQYIETFIGSAFDHVKRVSDILPKVVVVSDLKDAITAIYTNNTAITAIKTHLDGGGTLGQGSDGKSAYTLWKEANPTSTLTLAQWLAHFYPTNLWQSLSFFINTTTVSPAHTGQLLTYKTANDVTSLAISTDILAPMAVTETASLSYINLPVQITPKLSVFGKGVGKRTGGGYATVSYKIDSNTRILHVWADGAVADVTHFEIQSTFMV